MSWLNKLTTKDGKLAPTTNGKPQKSGSRSVTPSPSLPKISLPPPDSTPKLVLHQDSDSVSPMTVSPGSVHRADSMSPSVDEQGRSSDGASHRRYMTIANDEIPARSRHQSDAAPPKSYASSKSSRSRTNSVTDNMPAVTPGLTESPTQSVTSRRSGSMGSGESAPYQSISQIVDSPPQMRTRLASVGAASDKAPEQDTQASPGKSRRASRQHASSIGASAASSSPFGRSKVPARHQTTMGMGLASALVASGMGIAPPPSMLVSPTGGLAPPALSKKPSNVSSSNLTTNGRVSPERTRVVRPRARSSSSNSRPADNDSDDDSEEYDSGDALSFNDDEIPITGFAVATMKRNQEFHELFPQVPSDDYLIDDYGCALQRDILIQGRLYVSENHLCFHANIFGWVTDLVIPVTGVSVVEKKMTAFVIPNAIGITDQGTKYTFASFLARDTAYDVIYSVWRNGGPLRSASPGSETTPGVEGALAAPMNEPGSARVRKATQCACSKAGAHYPNTAMDVVLPGTPEQIYNLMFASGFIKDFLAKDQHLMDIQTSDWQPSPDNQKLLSRHMSYIKPLSGGFGPKQTKCELRDENQHIDFNEYASTITTTRTPDVPSGSVFAVKTRTCTMWAGSTTTKVVVTFTVEWTGKSFVKGIIERACTDGQKTYFSELEAAMRKYISDHRTEFLPEGVDAAAADQEAKEAALHPPVTKEATGLQPTGEKPIAASRSLQWALDTFEAATKVATDSISGLFDIVSDLVGGFTFSKTNILGIVIALLVISNVYTILTVGERRENGRRQVVERWETEKERVEKRETERETEKERWVGAAVKAFMEAQQSLQATAEPAPTVPPPPSLPAPVITLGAQEDTRAELEELRGVVSLLEARLEKIKSRLEQLD